MCMEADVYNLKPNKTAEQEDQKFHLVWATKWEATCQPSRCGDVA